MTETKMMEHVNFVYVWNSILWMKLVFHISDQLLIILRINALSQPTEGQVNYQLGLQLAIMFIRN